MIRTSSSAKSPLGSDSETPPALASIGCSQPTRHEPKWAALTPARPKSHNHCAELLVALVFKTKGALMTKRSFVAAAALTSCITGSAMAADMPAKAYRSFPAEVFSWSGFYVGHLVR